MKKLAHFFGYWFGAAAKPVRIRLLCEFCWLKVVESKSQLSESEFVACMTKTHHAGKVRRPNKIVLMDGVA
ncbi:hypothetical protein EDI28_26300 [Photobacterium chitinilyticum]|uniref:Uncharacterized protein n=1 Tax=Photobacterium chitinilyticum TaxID=2485123 RepID=A0A444JHX3_9GAMM|nr:hypothetical protein EDI28_26300 [Photobacterium chitinilyticum]